MAVAETLSPARKAATGNVRNVRAMKDAKLFALLGEMEAYRDIDPEAYEAVLAEANRRRRNRAE